MSDDENIVIPNKIQKMNKYADWERVKAPNIDANATPLIFQQIHLDNYESKPFQDISGNLNSCAPVIRMTGVTMEGNSVCCHVHGFRPYFYITLPADTFNDNDCEPLRKELDRLVLEDMRRSQHHIQEAVLCVEIVQRKNIMYYIGDDIQYYLKITVLLPRFVAATVRLLKNVGHIAKYNYQDLKAFESNIDFDIRFMVDNDVVGCNWIELPATKWKLRTEQTKLIKMSRCQLEADIHYTDLISHEPEGEWSKVAPFRILSFDIECAGRKGIFPEAKIDPVIQIANMVLRQGNTEPFIRNVFTLNTCADIVGYDVHSYKTETELLHAWAEFVRKVDADILTGYNINNFDIPYLLNRAAQLKVKDFEYLGRIKATPCVIKDTMLQSKQMGKRENKYVNFEGRVPFDLLFVLLRDSSFLLFK